MRQSIDDINQAEKQANDGSCEKWLIFILIVFNEFKNNP
jgi:hypothetical protein